MVKIATICVGDEFTIDPDGRLRLNPEGDPADLAWPYPCPVGTNNGLRRQPGGGLWVAPPPVLATASASGTLVHADSAVPAAMTVVTTAQIQINNPSTCHTASVMTWTTVDVDFDIFEADGRAAAQIAGDEYQRWENGAPAGGTNMDMHSQYTHPIIEAVTIPPGGSQLYSYPIAVGFGQGGSTYGDIRWRIAALIFAQT